MLHDIRMGLSVTSVFLHDYVCLSNSKKITNLQTFWFSSINEEGGGTYFDRSFQSILWSTVRCRITGDNGFYKLAEESATRRIFTFVRQVDGVQFIQTELPIYPSGAEHWQGSRPRDVGHGFMRFFLRIWNTKKKKTCVKKWRCLINSFIQTRRKLVKFFFNICGQRINRPRFVTSYDGRQFDEGLIVIVNQGY